MNGAKKQIKSDRTTGKKVYKNRRKKWVSLEKQRNTHKKRDITQRTSENFLLSVDSTFILLFFRVLFAREVRAKAPNRVTRDGKVEKGPQWRKLNDNFPFLSTLLTVFLRDVLASCKLHRTEHTSKLDLPNDSSFLFLRCVFVCVFGPFFSCCWRCSPSQSNWEQDEVLNK